MREMTIEQAIGRIAERTNDNTRELRKSRMQRRSAFTDLYGVPHSAQGDESHPARFYISVSLDLVYFLRFQFKLQVTAYQSSVASNATETLAADPLVISSTSTGIINRAGVTPNPHTHIVNYGIKNIPTTSETFNVYLDGVNLTPYLIEQQDGDWIAGEGLFPSGATEDANDFYDVLDAASLMYNEGVYGDDEDAEKKIGDSEKLLEPGFKLLEIYSDAKFAVTLHLYVKYSINGK